MRRNAPAMFGNRVIARWCARLRQSLARGSNRPAAGLGLVAAILLAGRPCPGVETPPKRILILNSYHQTYEWTDPQVEGIREVLETGLGNPEFYIEYLDTKRILREDYLRLLRDVYRIKYAQARLDVILSTDDDALTFLLKYRDELFGQVPVVFSGVNDAGESRVRGLSRMTGVVELQDIPPTIALGLKLFPSARQLIVISDATPTAQAQRASIAAAAGQFPRLRFEYLNGEDLSHDELLDKLRKVDAESLVLLAAYQRDRTGAYRPLPEICRQISECSPAPVFALVDSRLGQGIVGGKLVNGRLHGGAAGQMALRILKGERPENIPIPDKSTNPYMFDYRQLQRWRIPISALPPGSIIINEPNTFYHRHTQFIWTITGVFLFLVSVIVVLTVNILQRQRAEKAMAGAEAQRREERDRAQRYLDIAGVILVAIDKGQRVTLINQKGCEVLGLPQAEILGENWFDRFVPEYVRGKVKEVFSRLVAGELEPAEHFENPLITASGQERIIAWHNTLLRDESGAITGTLSSGEDVTARKRAEAELEQYRDHLEELVKARTAELEAVNKELEAFSYSVSHDLRAPLRAMDGFSQALLEDYGGRLDDQGKEYLTRVRNASQHMGQLIDDLLKLSRITRAEMHLEEVDLSALAAEVMDALRRSQPERQVAVSIEPDLKARGDAQLLGVLLTNLLGNAWKFTGKTPEARIEFGVEHQEGHPVFHVRDNGAGFDMTYAGKLFGAFQRLHGAAEFEGTGIGLATSQRIVHRHGGRIWAEGETGRGATFRFRLE